MYVLYFKYTLLYIEQIQSLRAHLCSTELIKQMSNVVVKAP